MLLIAIICIAVGYIWKSEQSFTINVKDTYYVLPYQTIFICLAIVFAFLFLIGTVRDMFRIKK